MLTIGQFANVQRRIEDMLRDAPDSEAAREANAKWQVAIDLPQSTPEERVARGAALRAVADSLTW